MSRTRGHGGVPWVWVGAGAGISLVIVGGAGLALYLSGAFEGRTERTAFIVASDKSKRGAGPEAKGGPADSSPAATKPDTGAGGRPFSGKWFLNIECPPGNSRMGPTVDFGGMHIDQTSPTRAIVSYQDTGLPAPANAEAQIVGDQLTFEWKAEAPKGETSYVAFSGKLSEPGTITASIKLVRRQEEASCRLTANTPERLKEKMKGFTPPSSSR